MRMWSCEDRSAPFVDVFKRSAQRHGYDLRLIAPTGEMPGGFAQFKASYRHLSPNPERFELASFRRWFEIASKVAAHERFVLADSDLVVALAFAALPQELRDFDGLVASIGATGNVLEDGINSGFSIWTGRLLRGFCDYMVATYQAGADDLATLHRTKIAAGQLRASISDMTLLYRWVQDAEIPFFNTNRALRDQRGELIYVDHNFFMPEALGLTFKMRLGRKAVYWDHERLLLRTDAGEPVIAASLHLGGRYKILATDLERRSQLGLAVKSAYILGGRTGRMLLARLGSAR